MLTQSHFLKFNVFITGSFVQWSPTDVAASVDACAGLNKDLRHAVLQLDNEANAGF